LYEVSSPPLLSESEVDGHRLSDDEVRDGHLSWLEFKLDPAFENRSGRLPNLLSPNELPCLLESPVSGHRDPAAELLDIEAARDPKSAPSPDPEAAPARSAQLPPVPLTPQVCEFPPKLGGEKLVPIDPPPVPTPAVVVAYSPIVCACACDARNDITAINTAAGNNNFFRLMASPC
jgi:hypothetical protein